MPKIECPTDKGGKGAEGGKDVSQIIRHSRQSTRLVLGHPPSFDMASSDGWNAMILGLNQREGGGMGEVRSSGVGYPSNEAPPPLAYDGQADEWSTIGISDAELAAQLGLWTNAQFTFDGPPALYTAGQEGTDKNADKVHHPLSYRSGDDLKAAERRRVLENKKNEGPSEGGIGGRLEASSPAVPLLDPSIMSALFPNEFPSGNNDRQAQANPAPNGESGSASPSVGPTASTSDEAGRLAIEEDKRKRNTAASYRFRLKKKAREEALAKSARSAEERVIALERRIGDLERENQWLKSLVVEKHGLGGQVPAIPTAKTADDSAHIPDDVYPNSAKRGIGTISGQ